MTVAAYRDRASGRYPVTVSEIRDRAGALFGAEPPADILASLKIDPVQATTPPTYDASKQMLTEGEPALSNGEWRQTWIVSALPPGPPGITYKADVWRRVTDTQAAILDTELTKLNVRSRRMWDDATYLSHDADEFQLLYQTMTTAFGKSEADRILAPSDV